MHKKDFTSFDVAVVVHELQNVVTNSRVNNIYQLNDKSLQLKLHKPDQPPLLLTLEAGRRLNLTAYALEKPRMPPAFCMALRKYLRNAWFRSVEQQEFERIATFRFDTKTGMKHLILELFGEGNLILTNEKNEILHALVHKRMRDRNILRGEVYKFPPASGKNPFKATREDLTAMLQETGDAQVVRILARGLGLGGTYAEETLLRARIEKSRSSARLGEAEVGAIYDSLRGLLSDVSAFKVEPQVVLDEAGEFLDVVPFRLRRYENCKKQTYPTFNEALDEFYLRVTADEKAVEFTSSSGEFKRRVGKLRHVVEEQELALSEAEIKAELDCQIGNVIYAHSVEIQTLLDRFNKAKLEGRDLAAVVSETSKAKVAGEGAGVVFESFDQRNLALNLCVEDLRFSVVFRKSLFENAAVYYERGKKLKQKAAGATAALEESRGKLAEAEKRMSEAESEKLAKPAELMEDFVKRRVEAKEWFEKFRWFRSSEAFLIVAGKDAVSNEVLIKKHVEKGEPVFHADVAGSPFVVIKTEGKSVGEQTLLEAGEFAATHSRAWREGLGSADVYWVTRDQLSKTGPSGEFVAHGAFAVVGKRNWLRGVPLRVAVGVVDNSGELRFVGGPVDAVKAVAQAFVVLTPGDLMGKELLRRVLQGLAVKLPKEQREKVSHSSVELVREFVPYTKGRITESS